jgi:hypothetical protein
MFSRAWVLAAGLAAAGLSFGQVQTQIGVPPTLEVQRLAPQLVGFAGGEVNFANLVNGLALGLPVTLTTPIGAGATQIVTFTPLGTMSSLQVAQTLELARQSLIARGVAVPTAQQIGVTLLGGSLQTAAGSTPMNALVASNTALAGSTVTLPTSTSAIPAGQTSATAGVRNTSDSPLLRGISDTPQTAVPGVASPGVPPAATTFANTTPRANSPFVSGAAPAAGGTVAPFAR